MFIIRFVLGKLILFFSAIFSPTPIVRNTLDQQKIIAATVGFSLYQFEACPFCVKVRRSLARQNIHIPIRDAKIEPYRSELLNGGGKVQTPCLRIDRGGNDVQWLYESKDIIAYIENVAATALRV